jgi:two-component system nitrate/nitrite response regulator NarL
MFAMSFQGPVKVLVVDDHVGIRRGIASLIDAEWPRLRSVGVAATANEAITQARERQPHVVVLDVNLGGEDGLALIPLLQRLVPCQIVVLTSLSDPHVAAQARRLGAHACLHKTAPAIELVACIFAAHLDHAAVTPLNAAVAVSQDAGSKHPSLQGNSADVGRGTAA